MRLLIVNYEFPPIGGGASFASYGLAMMLARRGHNVDVLTSRLAGQPEIENIGGVRIIRAKSWRRGPHDCGMIGAASFVAYALPRLRKLIASEKYDLIHYFFGMPSGLLALYSNGVHGIPYILSLRGSDVPGYDQTDLSLRFMHRALAGISRRIWRNARVVVPNSEGLRQLASVFEPNINYEVVPNAVVHAADSAPVLKMLRSRKRIRIICVARLIERKGINVLLNAVAQLPPGTVRLHVIGSGKDERRLRQLSSDLRIEGRVVFHGGLPREDVLSIYGRADLFVLPTLSESCSMALLEAMSYGLPIITTRVGGNPHLIRTGENGMLVTPGSVEELTLALQMLVDDPAKRRAMGQASLDRIAREFTWTINAERYEYVYDRARVIRV